jgi:hypothetical protein
MLVHCPHITPVIVVGGLSINVLSGFQLVTTRTRTAYYPTDILGAIGLCEGQGGEEEQGNYQYEFHGVTPGG